MSIFNQSQSAKVKKNKFDLSHDVKLSLKMGNLVPIMVQEVLPGDNFKVNSEIMLRMAPMIAPIMHRVNVFCHYFFVPNRIIWNNWEDFITGGPDGTSSPVHPFLKLQDTNLIEPGTLADYMGMPNLTEAEPIIFQPVSALPFRAYAEIYNEFYRDQTLDNPIVFSKGDGDSQADYVALTTMRQRAYEKDYFTSALPWAQRGPKSGAQVSYPNNGGASTVKKSSDGTQIQDGALQSTGGVAFVGSVGARIETQGEILIEELRRANALQRWLERNARGGARYIEQLLSHFGSAPNDARLQRPEYLGGGRQPVVISEVLNTAGAPSGGPVLDPVGEMSGHGISVGSKNSFRKSFTEHGHVIAIMSVIPKTGYMQGIPKMYMKNDRFDYAWPEFANIGEQEILNKELYYTGAAANNAEGTFGYTPRYAEYKYKMGTVHGEFKTSLSYWHLARIFANQPTLNSEFTRCKPDDTKRIFAVTSQETDDIYCQVFHNVSAIRPLPYFGTPSL